MNYAIIENNIVVNIIVGPLPNDMNGIFLGDRNVSIGDSYINNIFLHEGVPVLTSTERIAELEARIKELEGV